MEDKEKELIKELEESIKNCLRLTNNLGKLYHDYVKDSFDNRKNRQLQIDAMGEEEFEKFFWKKMKNYNTFATFIPILKHLLNSLSKVKANNKNSD